MSSKENIITTKSNAVSEIDEISILRSTIRSFESLVPIVTEDTRKLIPRNQNNMFAEKTKDMFFGGQMIE